MFSPVILGRRWAEALAVFAAMPRAKLAANVISYGAAMSACEKAARWEEAEVSWCEKPKCCASTGNKPSIPATIIVTGSSKKSVRPCSCSPVWEVGSIYQLWFVVLRLLTGCNTRWNTKQKTLTRPNINQIQRVWRFRRKPTLSLWRCSSRQEHHRFLQRAHLNKLISRKLAGTCA